jgi:hypothetical protein
MAVSINSGANANPVGLACRSAKRRRSRTTLLMRQCCFDLPSQFIFRSSLVISGHRDRSAAVFRQGGSSRATGFNPISDVEFLCWRSATVLAAATRAGWGGFKIPPETKPRDSNSKTHMALELLLPKRSLHRPENDRKTTGFPAPAAPLGSGRALLPRRLGSGGQW